MEAPTDKGSDLTSMVLACTAITETVKRHTLYQRI